MREYPLVTVIIPSYNHAQYIREAIESVFEQTYPNWELVVVDDGSIDDTASVLKEYEGVDRVTVICNPDNKGQSAVVNQALSIAKGQYVCFLPSDDWYCKEKLEIQVEKFLTLGTDYGVVYGRGQRYYVDSKVLLDVDLPLYSGDVLNHLVDSNFVYPVTPMFRRECFERFPFDESYAAEGEAIYLKLATVYKFDYVDQVVGVMRDHSYNTGKAWELMYRDNIRYWEEFFARSDIPETLRKLKDSRISMVHRQYGMIEVARSGDGALSRKMLAKAIRLDLQNLLDWRMLAAYALSFIRAPQRTWLLRKVGKAID